jgi:hypothetical protein
MFHPFFKFIFLGIFICLFIILPQKSFALSNSVYGHVYINSVGVLNATVKATSGSTKYTTKTDSSGYYAFSGVNSGQPWSVTATVPDGRTQSSSGQAGGNTCGGAGSCNNVILSFSFPALVTPTPIPTIPPTSTPAILTPTPIQGYSISGNVFIDANKNGVKDGGEPNYTGTPTVTASQGTVVANSNGSYTISNLPPGVVTISVIPPPSYTMTYPLNGPPSTFQVTVGPGCNTNGANGATCN